ncbi:MAG TPA: hypothetical protein VFZ89_16970 [Solirubrobacteraceae bacterium]
MPPAEPTYTAEQVDAAMASLSDPERLRHAQEVVTHAAPGLQRLLNMALDEGGYFDGPHDQAVTEAAAIEDPAQRATAVHTLVAEQTRLGMLIGATVGFELARELQRNHDTEGE